MNKFMNKQIEQAIHAMRLNEARYARTERYYDGRHELAFASEKFQNTFGALFREFAMNLCPAVCDSIRDKLIIREFGTEEAGESAAEAVGKESRRIWQQNRMATRAAEIHNEAVKNGDAYAIVWPDASGRPAIFPNRAVSCTAAYDEGSPGRITWAAKHWKTPDKYTRLNLFFPDRIEKYTTAKPSERALPDAKE